MPIATVVAVIAAIIVSFIGSGALGGTPVSEAADGALSADATPFAPDGPAFSIWSVIYLGLIVYAIYQMLPAPRKSVRQAALRPWAALSALLNAVWILVVQADSVLGSVAVIVVLLAVLIRVFLILLKMAPSSRVDMLVTDGTFGLYLGWVCVATTANTAAFVATLGLDTFPGWEWVAVGVIAAVVAIAIFVTGFSQGRIAPGLAIAWGLAWIAVARTTGEFASTILVWAAGLAAAAVLLSAITIRVLTTKDHSSTATTN